MTSERRKDARDRAVDGVHNGDPTCELLSETLDALDEAERKLEAMHAESDKRDDEIDREAWARGMEDAAKIAEDHRRLGASSSRGTAIAIGLEIASVIRTTTKEHTDGN